MRRSVAGFDDLAEVLDHGPRRIVGGWGDSEDAERGDAAGHGREARELEGERRVFVDDDLDAGAEVGRFVAAQALGDMGERGEYARIAGEVTFEDQG
ncbi:MAG: hypothetical protein U0359_26410 [Byssovorax sp.]